MFRIYMNLCMVTIISSFVLRCSCWIDSKLHFIAINISYCKMEVKLRISLISMIGCN